jgi:hypothetical protein
MKKIVATLLLILATISSTALAKRGPIPTVAPIECNGVRYVAPNDDGKREYIQAFNIVTGELLQETTLKRNMIWPWLEGDVQVVYIISIQIKDEMLFISDEKRRVFKHKLLKRPQLK